MCEKKRLTTKKKTQKDTTQEDQKKMGPNHELMPLYK